MQMTYDHRKCEIALIAVYQLLFLCLSLLFDGHIKQLTSAGMYTSFIVYYNRMNIIRRIIRMYRNNYFLEVFSYNHRYLIVISMQVKIMQKMIQMIMINFIINKDSQNTYCINLIYIINILPIMNI